ncbi:hypothetical protein EDD18DRAFT_1360977 [Armillaria luteobubalina]|uniref:Uncharacterized protein n=1 Tax=Armillaria luteobubalina TaxID=153913 RepID=A0AA39PJM5_9AGAR|nr:hypothetical protein EDD18DRAFT_1360977 [Armillaria luteobubalina]
MFDTSNVTLQATGLIALADLPPVVIQTTLIGTTSYSDALVISPGMHHQQATSEINHEEFPITGTMTTRYILHVKNPATVHYLQSISIAGHLVAAHIYLCNDIFKESSLLQSFIAGLPTSLLYTLCPMLTIIVTVSLAHIQDLWALGVLGGFVVLRLINVVIIKWRDERGWKGQKQPGGTVDDLEAVASGQWLRDMTSIDNFAVMCAMMLIYISAALSFNASMAGSMLIASLLLSTAALLTLCNSSTQWALKKYYKQRLALANELIAEMGGWNDWAIGMGLVLPETGEERLINV